MTMGINLIEGRGRKKGKSEYRGLFKKKKRKNNTRTKFQTGKSEKLDWKENS